MKPRAKWEKNTKKTRLHPGKPGRFPLRRTMVGGFDLSAGRTLGWHSKVIGSSFLMSLNITGSTLIRTTGSTLNLLGSLRTYGNFPYCPRKNPLPTRPPPPSKENYNSRFSILGRRVFSLCVCVCVCWRSKLDAFESGNRKRITGSARALQNR